MSDLSDAHLAPLGPRFVRAMELRGAGRVDEAMDELREILRIEPRLAEPRMELGRILLEMGKLDDAEVHAREAIRILESGGQWTEEVAEHVLLSMAWALLGAILQETAASDEVVFGDVERFEELVAMSRAAYAKAAQLDPDDTASALNAAELGDRGDDEAEH